MKQKILEFIIAFLINGVIFLLIHYLVDNDYTTSQLVKMGLFFGVSMGLFQVLIMPYIQKRNNRKWYKVFKLNLYSYISNQIDQ